MFYYTTLLELAPIKLQNYFTIKSYFAKASKKKLFSILGATKIPITSVAFATNY